jgi:hypothetical protein
LRWVLLFLAGTALGGAIAFLAVGGLIWLEEQEKTGEVAVDDPTPETDPPTGDPTEPKPETPAVDPSVPAGCPAPKEESPVWALNADGESAAEPLQLPKPNRRLARRIKYWEQFWGEADRRTYIFHDNRRPSLIYAVMDCKDLFEKMSDAEKADKACDKRLFAKKRTLNKFLKRQRRRPNKVIRSHFDNDRRLIKSAPRHLRIRWGMTDKLAEGKVRAAPYLKRIEAIYAEVGVPPRLSRLAFTESIFDPVAVSDAGAVGAFQFMAPTARKWLMVNDRVDERLDPIRSAWASAEYLKEMNGKFKDWGLTLTAYNTGPGRMSKLIKRHRTRDIGKLADMRTERSFGFDGQNYFASFSAIANLTADVEMDNGPLSREVVSYDKELPLEEIARCQGSTVQELAQANAALKPAVVSGEAKVPKGYMVALPSKGDAKVAENTDAPPAEKL